MKFKGQLGAVSSLLVPWMLGNLIPTVRFTGQALTPLSPSCLLLTAYFMYKIIMVNRQHVKLQISRAYSPV